MAQRLKIPIRGGYFVLTPKTQRFVITRPDGTPVAELLVNAGGNGAIVLVPPGARLTASTPAEPYTPSAAVELLRRDNAERLSSGRPEHVIPAALIRRAKSLELPGIDALIPFPGKLKTFYAGRGSWDGTGLWVSWDGEFSLEMRAPIGVLRKVLTDREARAWLASNGHTAWTAPHGEKPIPQTEPDQWRIATKGHPGEGARSWWAISWPAVDEADEQKPTARDEKLRESLKRTRSVAPPQISPPRKRSERRRKR